MYNNLISSLLFKSSEILTPNYLRTVYKILIESRLKFCSAVWENCGATLKHKVQRLQGRALGILSTDRGNRNHDCLRVQQLIDQDIAITVFKSLNGNASNYLKQMFVALSEVHTHNTRNYSTGLFPFYKYVFAGCRVWSSLSKDVRTSETIGDFKLKLRKHLQKE